MSDDVATADESNTDTRATESRPEWIIRLPDGSWVAHGSKAARFTSGGYTSVVEGADRVLVFTALDAAVQGAADLKKAADEVGADGYVPVVYERRRTITYTRPVVSNDAKGVFAR